MGREDEAETTLLLSHMVASSGARWVFLGLGTRRQRAKVDTTVDIPLSPGRVTKGRRLPLGLTVGQRWSSAARGRRVPHDGGGRCFLCEWEWGRTGGTGWRRGDAHHCTGAAHFGG